MVSNGGGTSSLWRRDGKELFYFFGWKGDDRGSQHDRRVPNWNSQAVVQSAFWDVSADAKRFVMAVPSPTNAAQPNVTLVLNWQAVLKK
jgi:hypothetical protein